MTLAVYIIATLLIIMCLGLYISFTLMAGKDERGQSIIARSSQVAFIFILLGFVFQSIFINFANPTIDAVSLMITVWMAIVFISNSVSIIYLNKKM